jgi:hypothetical protein
MKTYKVAIASLIFSLNPFSIKASNAISDITLKDVYVSHVGHSVTLTVKTISLLPLKIEDSSWYISCNFNVMGAGKKSDITFSALGSVIYLNDSEEGYLNNGLLIKKGSLHFQIDSSSFKYENKFKVVNYDKKNDVKITHCKAISTNG